MRAYYNIITYYLIVLSEHTVAKIITKQLVNKWEVLV